MSELQREVVVLQTQLEEARRKESGLSEALSTARQAMELYQKATQQDVSAGAGCMQLCTVATSVPVLCMVPVVATICM